MTNKNDETRYRYDKIKDRVIMEEITKEQEKPPDEKDLEKIVLLYQAMYDDSESIVQGYKIRRPYPGLSLDRYYDLWEWIEAETTKRKSQLKSNTSE